MTRCLLFLCVSVSFIIAKAQIPGKLYYTKYWELTTKDSSFYFRTCVLDTPTVQFVGEVKDFTSQGQLVMEGMYQFGKKNGIFTHYYASGQIESQGGFNDNRQVGIWKYFYENGDLQQEVDFRGGDFFINSFIDRSGKKLVENGTGDWKYAYDEYRAGKITIEGHFEDGKKAGDWLCYFENGDKIYEEKFKKGKLIRGVEYPRGSTASRYEKPKTYTTHDFTNKLLPHYKHGMTESFSALESVTQKDYPYLKFLRKYVDPSVSPTIEFSDTTKDGSQVFMIVEKPAEPNGGLEGLFQLLSKNLKYPATARQHGIEGSVFVSFIVERDGTLTDTKVVKGIGGGCDEEAVRVVQLSSPWVPGMQRGKPVRCRFVLPVKFHLAGPVKKR